MEVEKTTETEEVKPQDQMLSDLPVNNELANETNGGNNLLNHAKVMLRDTQ